MPARPNNYQLTRKSLGSFRYLGSIVTTAETAKNNGDTAVPFLNLSGKVLLLQVDGTCFIHPQAASAGAVTAANGLKVTVDKEVTLTLQTNEPYLSVIREAGTNVTVKVFELL